MNTNSATDDRLLSQLSGSVAMLALRSKPIRISMKVASMALAATKALPALSQVAAMELAKTLAGVFENAPWQSDAEAVELCASRGYGADVAESMSKAWRGEVGE